MIQTPTKHHPHNPHSLVIGPSNKEKEKKKEQYKHIIGPYHYGGSGGLLKRESQTFSIYLSHSCFKTTPFLP
ncbi:hypothetical protein HYC85_021543 [Camellia sinensis]|uniref:Uncharacterized protein n=1 Tax=Camellia sinensis TaxID=4442 RepID=A0A7J7GLS0_CAMSI|nr:hypothetical protein HYC85_021543 [Camellia sinensis]